MAPKLRISVSKDTAYPPTHPIEINTATPTRIQTGSFEGDIRVWIKGYNGEGADDDGNQYFDHVHERGEKRNLTYAISLRGRFNEDVNGDDLLFGNVFERPIKNNLPWGTSVAMRFTHYIDPTLEHDVYADKPWALSPVLGCMSVLTLSETHSEEAQQVVMHEQSAKYLQSQDEEFTHEEGVQDRLERQRWFSSGERREKVVVKKGMEVGMEFSNGFLDFNTLSLNLPYPISMQIPLLQYWDGQPVIYVCRNRSKPGTSPVDPEGMFFSIGFEIVDEDAIEALEEKGGEVLWLADIGKETKGDEEEGSEDEEEEGQLSDDVD